jgi:hypothetical protein
MEKKVTRPLYSSSFQCVGADVVMLNVAEVTGDK